MGRLARGVVLALRAAVGVLAIAPARAADLPVAPAAARSYVPAIYDWTGVYFGGQVGGGMLQDTVTATATVVETTGTQTRYSPFSVVGGGQVGLNFEMTPLVVGFEADWLASNISGSQNAPSIVAGAVRSTSSPHWYAMATGRIGYAADDMLFYAKGGAAFMNVKYDAALLAAPGGVVPPGAVTSISSLTDNRAGFTVGAGFEYALNEALSLRGEYDFLDFGSKSYTFPLTTPAGAGVLAPFSISSNTHLFLAGFNYRFNWVQRSPVAARY